METAHKNHIIHRDIKPHNIIITEDGVAKVTDFGIAKAVSNSTITAFGTTIGSVHYFSPEHARGGFTDEKSDLYSLGVVMYEMLTGKVPFDADTAVSIALKHMQEEAKPPIELNPNIPSAVNDIIMKALRKDTNLRYQNATAMLLDLKRALKEPNGDFVDNNDYQDFPTQRISTLGLTIGISNARRPKEVAIPNLVGKTVDEAKQILTENKLNYVEDSSEYNTTYPAGQIISQTPNFVDGRKIKQNTDVKVVVSLGTETTTVPKLKGLTKDEAEDAAKSSKIKLEFVDEISKTVEAGVIIKQEKEEGETVNAGDTVKVYVSIGTGIKQVAVVSVLYKDEETAKQTLQDLGLTVNVEYGEDKTRGNGVVLKQSIESGKTVDEGSTITITVNKLAELKTGTVTINVKSLTNFQDTYEETTTNTVTGEKETVKKQNKAQDVTLKVTVDGEQVYKNSVKENNTAVKVDNVSGTGRVQIKVYIDDTLKRTVDMDLSKTTTMTIE